MWRAIEGLKDTASARLQGKAAGATHREENKNGGQG